MLAGSGLPSVQWVPFQGSGQDGGQWDPVAAVLDWRLLAGYGVLVHCSSEGLPLLGPAYCVFSCRFSRGLYLWLSLRHVVVGSSGAGGCWVLQWLRSQAACSFGQGVLL